MKWKRRKRTLVAEEEARRTRHALGELKATLNRIESIYHDSAVIDREAGVGQALDFIATEIDQVWERLAETPETERDPDIGFELRLRALRVRARLGELQVGNPFALWIRSVWPFAPAHEMLLHRIFDEHRLEGEWFDAYPNTLECWPDEPDPIMDLLTVQSDLEELALRRWVEDYYPRIDRWAAHIEADPGTTAGSPERVAWVGSAPAPHVSWRAYLPGGETIATGAQAAA